MINIIPGGRYVVAVDAKIESKMRIVVPHSTDADSFIPMKVLTVGSLINEERKDNEEVETGDIILVKKVDSNPINFQGQKFYYVYEGSIALVEEVDHDVTK